LLDLGSDLGNVGRHDDDDPMMVVVVFYFFLFYCRRGIPIKVREVNIQVSSLVLIPNR
jgi:hypothetical protein